MKLPDAILAEVRAHFDPHHPAWHFARVRPEPTWSAGQKAAWKKARMIFPQLTFRGDEGSGAEFLIFHRNMMREYKWMLTKHPESGLTYSPWKKIPDTIAATIDQWIEDGSTKAGQERLIALIATGSLNALGDFIEPAPQGRIAGGQGLHDLGHGAVAEIEKAQGLPEEFSMGSPGTAHRNIVFYELHGWIDELYAAWQRAHGETPDLSPKEPDDMRISGLEVGASPDDLAAIVEAVDVLIPFPRLGK